MKTILNRISQWLFGKNEIESNVEQKTLPIKVQPKEAITVPLFSTPTPFKKGIA